jgi:hypothetical protein
VDRNGQVARAPKISMAELVSYDPSMVQLAA